MKELGEPVRKMESRILSMLKAERRELHIERLAAELGVARHTAAKYLEILRAKGKVQFRKVGNAKLWRSYSDVAIRALTPADIPAVLHVERLIEEELGEVDLQRQSHLEGRVRHWVAQGGFALGAHLEERLLGFAFGEVRDWQFGCASKTGWVEVIGVDPEFRRLGIGRALAQELLTQFKMSGAERVRTLVDLYSGDLLTFFHALGFEHLNMLPLELQLGVETASGPSEASGDHRKNDGGGREDHDSGH